MSEVRGNRPVGTEAMKITVLGMVAVLNWRSSRCRSADSIPCERGETTTKHPAKPAANVMDRTPPRPSTLNGDGAPVEQSQLRGLHSFADLSKHSRHAQGTPIRQLHGENPCRVESSSQQGTRSRKSGNVDMYIRRDGRSRTLGFLRNGLTVSFEWMCPDKPSKPRFGFRLDCVATE